MPAGAPPATTIPGTPTDPALPPPADGGGDAPGAGALPPGAQAIIDAVKRSPANNTSRLLAALRPLTEYGVSADDAVTAGFGHFPVGGVATFSDDWLYPRFFPTFHFHQGTDIFAARGTPVRAPVDGTTRITDGAVGGLAAYVTMPDRTYFYMAHLDSLAPGITDAMAVRQGTILGYVGDSGDARGGATHCHFEIHPQGGPAVDPKAYLDAWLSEAEKAAPALVAAYDAARPRSVASGSVTLQFSDRSDGLFAAPSGPPHSALLWATSASPTGGALQLAESQADAASRLVDWAARAREAQAGELAIREAQRQAAAYLDPLLPPALQGILHPA